MFMMQSSAFSIPLVQYKPKFMFRCIMTFPLPGVLFKIDSRVGQSNRTISFLIEATCFFCNWKSITTFLLAQLLHLNQKKRKE